MLLFFHQNYLSSRGKSWKDLRQEALQNLEQGRYYPTGKPACLHIWKIHMQQKWKNWASAVLLLNESNKSVPVRLSHLWKYHHVLLLRPAGFKRPCLQLQTEHPFIRTARSDRTDVFSSSYSSPDINGVVCFSFTCPVLRVCNNWICCCFLLQLLSQLVPTVTGDATVAPKWRHIMQCKFHLWLWGSYCFCRACALGSPLGGALALTGVSLGCVKGVEDASGHVNSALIHWNASLSFSFQEVQPHLWADTFQELKEHSGLFFFGHT